MQKMTTLTLMRSTAIACAACAFLALSNADASHASTPSVKLYTAFAPDRLGASTTIAMDFSIQERGGGLPPPLSRVRLGLPPGVGLATTTLGLATCSEAQFNIEGCPANALMGHGTALVAVPAGREVIYNSAKVTIAMAAASHEHTTMEIYTVTKTPVSAELAFPAALIEEPHAGAYLETSVPIIPTVPDGPDVAVVDFESTFGPAGLVYHRRVRGKTVSYQPLGTTVPTTCPRGGFLFTVAMTFADGSDAFASHAVPCPSRPMRKR
jgi:hypothetical protein